MKNFLKRFAKNEDGATLVEYALLLCLVASLAIGGLKLLGNSINNTMNQVASSISSTQTAGDPGSAGSGSGSGAGQGSGAGSGNNGNGGPPSGVGNGQGNGNGNGVGEGGNNGHGHNNGDK